jgi:hypothetical protein
MALRPQRSDHRARLAAMIMQRNFVNVGGCCARDGVTGNVEERRQFG